MKVPKILYKYISQGLVVNFLVSVIIFTFILFTVSMAKVAEWLVNGASLLVIIKLFLLLLPYLLSTCIPMAFLTSILLVFGRMSHDSEIIAMKASGISIYQIALPVISMGLILSCISIPLNNQVLAKTHYAFRKTVYSLGVQQPSAFLEPGTFIDTFSGYNIFIKEKKNNVLKNIVIYQTTEKGQTRTITAKSGTLLIDSSNKKINFSLKDGTVSEPEHENSQNFYSIKFGRYKLSIDASEILRDPSQIKKKHKNMTILELRQKIHSLNNKHIISVYLTEIHKKLSISFSCFVFALIGIPLGIKAHRSEKSIGASLSLGITLIYYLLIIFGKALDQNPMFYPHLLMWFPTLFIGSIGIYLLHKVASY